MIFNILFIADRKKIELHRQRQTNLNIACENKGRIDYDYKVGQKVLVWNNGILRKAESRYLKDPPDYHLSPYKLNNQGSIQKQIWKGEYPESKAVWRIKLDNK
jgi:hypothetical protein